MGTLFGFLALAGGGALAWYGHKQINRVDNQLHIMHQAIQQIPGSGPYLIAFSNPGRLPH